MAEKLESLTPEQWARVEEVRAQALLDGRSTAPPDWAEAERGVILAYEGLGKPAPRIVRAPGPRTGSRMAALLAEDSSLTEEQLMERLKEPTAELKEKSRAQVGQACYGPHDLYWLVFYEFLAEVCPEPCQPDTLKSLQGSLLVARNAGWWWALDGVAVVSERPVEVSLDDQGRLHSETGMATSYRDGWGLWSWHGVRVTQQIIEDPASLAFEQIKGEGNAEVRRIMVERYGAGKYLHEVGATVVDMDASPVEGGAPRCLMRDDTGDQWLVGTDGSTERVYTMPVPDDVQTCQEAHEAISGIPEGSLIAEC
jgi:hypothetical protein